MAIFSLLASFLGALRLFSLGSPFCLSAHLLSMVSILLFFGLVVCWASLDGVIVFELIMVNVHDIICPTVNISNTSLQGGFLKYVISIFGVLCAPKKGGPFKIYITISQLVLGKISCLPFTFLIAPLTKVVSFKIKLNFTVIPLKKVNGKATVVITGQSVSFIDNYGSGATKRVSLFNLVANNVKGGKMGHTKENVKFTTILFWQSVCHFNWYTSPINCSVTCFKMEIFIFLSVFSIEKQAAGVFGSLSSPPPLS